MSIYAIGFYTHVTMKWLCDTNNVQHLRIYIRYIGIYIIDISPIKCYIHEYLLNFDHENIIWTSRLRDIDIRGWFQNLMRIITQKQCCSSVSNQIEWSIKPILSVKKNDDINLYRMISMLRKKEKTDYIGLKKNDYSVFF